MLLRLTVYSVLEKKIKSQYSNVNIAQLAERVALYFNR